MRTENSRNVSEKNMKIVNIVWIKANKMIL